MREIDKLYRWERLRLLMPQVLGVLVDAEADFSKCVIPSEAEVEAAINAAMSEDFF